MSRRLTPEHANDRALAATKLMRGVMYQLGFDLEDENFKETPERFVKYLVEYLQPVNLEETMKVGFAAVKNDYKGMVVQTNIPFRTICPHHLLPVVGSAHLGYIPNNRVVGLSKLTRLVEVVGHEKPRMQEDITDLLANILAERLEARGSIVVISSHHMCMAGRGVCVDNTPTVTSSVRGVFRDVQAARDEFFRLLRVASK